jgi:hypothetical protein
MKFTSQTDDLIDSFMNSVNNETKLQYIKEDISKVSRIISHHHFNLQAI